MRHVCTDPLAMKYIWLLRSSVLSFFSPVVSSSFKASCRYFESSMHPSLAFRIHYFKGIMKYNH